jgi:hypothetical protein
MPLKEATELGFSYSSVNDLDITLKFSDRLLLLSQVTANNSAIGLLQVLLVQTNIMSGNTIFDSILLVIDFRKILKLEFGITNSSINLRKELFCAQSMQYARVNY